MEIERIQGYLKSRILATLFRRLVDPIKDVGLNSLGNNEKGTAEEQVQ